MIGYDIQRRDQQ